MLHHRRARRVRTAVWLAILVTLPALLPATATAQDGATGTGLTPRLLADASWHGRPIQRPLPQRSDVSDRRPSLRPGTGLHSPAGSRRVRALQRRLTRLGYRPGSSDGRFGPRTQAALLAFQRKHGLRRTGAAGRDTLRVLRTRTAPDAPTDPGTRLQTQSVTPMVPTAAPPAAPTATTGDPSGVPALAIVLALAAALGLIAMASAFLRARTVLATPAAKPQPQPRPLPEPLWLEPAPASDPEPDLQPEPEPEPTPIPTPTPTPTPTQEAHHDEDHDPPRIVRPPFHGTPRDRRIALRERILAMREEGMTLQQIADRLTAEGETTLGGGRFWQPWSVRAATRPVGPTATQGRRARR